MAIFKYKNPTTNEWEAVIGGGGTANGIPITSNPSDDTTVWIDTSEDGGVVSSTHASTHASDGSDPITPESIGAQKLYTNITQLGLTIGNETIEDILNAMSPNSVLRYAVTSAHNTAIYPYDFGIMEVKYANASAYRELAFTATANNSNQNRRWSGSAQYVDNAWVFSGWEGYLRYFTSLTPLGITKGEETIASMIAAMPNYSMLMLQVNTESDGYNPATYPSAWGLLTIKRYNNYRVEIDYMDIKSNPKTFYKKSWNNGTESDWFELLHTGNMSNSAILIDEIYTVPRLRGSALVNIPTEPTINGVITWLYE